MFTSSRKFHATLVFLIIGILLIAISPILAQGTGDVCGVEIFTLWAGQTNNAGDVTLYHDDVNLYVTYTTSDGSDIEDIHVYVYTSLGAIPDARPVPGDAPYKVENINDTTYTLAIPFTDIFGDGFSWDTWGEDVTIYVVAHAALSSGETAYGGGTGAGDTSWFYYMEYVVQPCDPEEPPAEGDGGCTPGYWKNHEEDWAGLTDLTLDDVFNFPDSLSDLREVSLMDALQGGGGNDLIDKAAILMRAATAGYLNVLYVQGDVSYPESSEWAYINMVNDALASEDPDVILALADEIDGWNNGICELGGPNVDEPIDNGTGDGTGDTSGGEGIPGEAQVTICHIPPGNPPAAHLITVGESAWPAHQSHGDTRDTCPSPEELQARLGETQRGKSGDNNPNNGPNSNSGSNNRGRSGKGG